MEDTKNFDGPNTTNLESGKPRKPRSDAQKAAFEKAKAARAKQIEELKTKPKADRSFRKVATSLLERVDQLQKQVLSLRETPPVTANLNEKESTVKEKNKMRKPYEQMHEEGELPEQDHDEDDDGDDMNEVEEDEAPAAQVTQRRPQSRPIPIPKASTRNVTTVKQVRAPQKPPSIQKRRREDPEDVMEENEDEDEQYEDEELAPTPMQSYETGYNVAPVMSAAQRAGVARPSAHPAVPAHRVNPQKGPATKLHYSDRANQLDQFQKWLSMA